jgi:hypothetical protein
MTRASAKKITLDALHHPKFSEIWLHDLWAAYDRAADQVLLRVLTEALSRTGLPPEYNQELGIRTLYGCQLEAPGGTLTVMPG